MGWVDRALHLPSGDCVVRGTSRGSGWCSKGEVERLCRKCTVRIALTITNSVAKCGWCGSADCCGSVGGWTTLILHLSAHYGSWLSQSLLLHNHPWPMDTSRLVDGRCGIEVFSVLMFIPDPVLIPSSYQTIKHAPVVSDISMCIWVVLVGGQVAQMGCCRLGLVQNGQQR